MRLAVGTRLAESLVALETRRGNRLVVRAAAERIKIGHVHQVGILSKVRIEERRDNFNLEIIT